MNLTMIFGMDYACIVQGYAGTLIHEACMVVPLKKADEELDKEVEKYNESEECFWPKPIVEYCINNGYVNNEGMETRLKEFYGIGEYEEAFKQRQLKPY